MKFSFCHRLPLFILVLAHSFLPLRAAEPDKTARPIPVTRPEMKRMLEDMKSRQPRIPLPELTSDEQQQLGERATDYETRLRFHYLIEGEGSAFGSRPRTPATAEGSAGSSTAATRDLRRNSDENMSLTYEFKTKLFWIVSRTNNCQYCLGHQEQKLSAAGVADETLAALDTDWASFSPAEQAAFSWARKLTWTPHSIRAADIDALRRYYSDLQILEMTMSVAGNNAINRWKEGTGVAQSEHGGRFFENSTIAAAPGTLPIDSFLTPTAPEYQQRPSMVATLDFSAKDLTNAVVIGVPPIDESPDQVRQQLQQMAERHSRLPLRTAAEARAVFHLAATEHVPAWMRLLANFPNESLRRLNSLHDIQVTDVDLSELDRARVSWVVARQDRAWYAVAHAQQRLQQLGQTDAQIFAIDGDLSQLPEMERAILVMAKKLATSPITLNDADVARVIELAGPRRATQLINYVTSRAYFDRVTEAAGLSTSEDQTQN